MKKDTFYRFRNDENRPWRSLLIMVAKAFRRLTAKVGEEDDTERKIQAFILDDTADARVGKKIEGVSWVFDHTLKHSVLGFKHLVLAHHDGRNTIPIDFSLHREKALKGRDAKRQAKKETKKRSSGAKRRKELRVSKLEQGLVMIKRALKHGFKADYVLTDSWFTSLDFIKTVRTMATGSIHVIAGIRADRRKYSSEGEVFNAKELIKKRTSIGKPHRCRSLKTLYYETVVSYDGVGEVKLLICRYPGQKAWRLFISTDTELSFIRIMSIYGIRWDIEVLFRDEKQHLSLGKCQSTCFDAQIASATFTHILFIILTYIKSTINDTTIGTLMRQSADEIQENMTAQRLWAIFEAAISSAVENLSKNAKMELNDFCSTSEFAKVKALFASSFLSNQISDLCKSA